MPPNLPAPFCANCKYELTGCTDTTNCPECGLPIVEVLTRGGGAFGKRYRSSATLFGLPLVDIAQGPVPGEPIGRARGVFAFGDRAVGLFAMGGRAIGLVAFGGVAIGGVAIGGAAFGLIGALGGLAVGAMTSGGVSIGLLASGGVVFGLLAMGGVPMGYYALGGMPIGVFTAGAGGNSAEAVSAASHFQWFFGSLNRFSLWTMIQPALCVAGAGLMLTAAVGLLSLVGLHRAERAP